MSNSQDIMPFQFENHPIRIVTDNNGNPWFNANDVCGALGYANPRDALALHVDPDDVGKRDTIDKLGRTQSTNHINESGIYSLIFGSKKPEAKRFKRWVTSEVLPTIRKTGQYSVGPKTLTGLEMDLLIASTAGDMLRLSDAGRIKMLSTVMKQHGRPSTMLPDYTEEEVTQSLTALLKEHGSELSTRRANKILLDIGILEINTRPSSNGGTKIFKSLTEKGQRFGKNLISPHNEKETQPHYFVSTFAELLGLTT